jgi:hypothetical protein
MNLEKIKSVLIDDVHKSWKYYSMKLSIIGIVVMGLLTQLPDQLLASWTILPDSIKQGIPADRVGQISMVLLGLTALARVVKQTEATAKEAEAKGQ